MTDPCRNDEQRSADSSSSGPQISPQAAIAIVKRLQEPVRATMGGKGLQPNPIRSSRKNMDRMRDIVAVMRRDTYVGQASVPQNVQDELDLVQFERDIWNQYGLGTGEVDITHLLKECQKRVIMRTGTDPEHDNQLLQALNEIHHWRRESGRQDEGGQILFRGTPGNPGWQKVVPTEPDEQSRSIGAEGFWALIIGNDKYPQSPLRGCIADTELIKKYLIEHLGVPDDNTHINVLHDADRESMVTALYNLRDNDEIMPGDNVLIHFSGHGSTYYSEEYFGSLPAGAGSIEALCPVDRGLPNRTTSLPTPDISDRELNSLLSEIRDERQANITVILDCCHSGGATRFMDTQDRARGMVPLSGKEAIVSMFEAADLHPRRHSKVSVTSETWVSDGDNIDSHVVLAACQDFEKAGDGKSGGAFTTALVNVLRSEEGRTATYASIIEIIGDLGGQMPAVVGAPKGCRLWYQEPESG